VRALPRRRPMCRPLTPCSIHLDHQDDPVPLLPQRPAAAPGGGRKTGRARARDTPACAWPRPAIWGTANTHHTTSRPAAAHPDAAGRGQGRGNRSQPGPSRAPGRRRPTLNDLQKSILAATHKLRADWAPAGCAL